MFHKRLPPPAQLLLSGNDFSGYFGRSVLAGSKRVAGLVTAGVRNPHSKTAARAIATAS